MYSYTMTIGLIVGEILRRHIKLKSPVLGRYMKTLTLDVGNKLRPTSVTVVIRVVGNGTQTHVSHGGH